MAVSRKLMGVGTFILSCLMVAVVAVAVARLSPGGSPASWGATNIAPHLPADGSLSPELAVRQPMMLPPDRIPVAPLDMGLATLKSQFARYDSLVVEVHRDGSLCVLGEPMPREAFLSLVGELRGQLGMVITIQPDDNCPFRYVGPIISMCEEAGVPHQTLPGPDRTMADVVPGGPA